jgi:O-antigen/teichoic acid export membrane protein
MAVELSAAKGSPSVLFRSLARGGDYLFYLLAWVAIAGSEFGFVPLLSRLFTKTEYGHFLLVFGLLVFLSDMVSVWASASFLRQGAAMDVADREQLRGMLLLFVLIAAVAVSIGIAAAGLALAVDGETGLSRALLAGAIYLPALAAFSFALADYQAAGRTRMYFGISVARTTAIVTGGLVGVTLFSKHAAAFLGGSGVGLLLIITPYIVVRVRFVRPGTENRRTLRSAFSFGIGMWFQQLGAKILRIGDRYVISAVLGAAAVGVYGAGYTLLFGVLSALVLPLILLLTPKVYATGDRAGDQAVVDLLGRVLRYYIPIAALVVAAVFVVSPIFLRVLLPGGYAAAFSSAMALALIAAPALHGATLTLNLVLELKRRIKASALLFLAVAVGNVVANMLLVPWLGIAGAVWATLGSYVALFALTYTVSRSYLLVDIPLRQTIVCVGSLLIVFLVVRASEDAPLWAAASIQGIALVGCLGAVLFASPELSRHWEQLRSLRSTRIGRSYG